MRLLLVEDDASATCAASSGARRSPPSAAWGSTTRSCRPTRAASWPARARRVDRLTAIVRDLLTLARADEGRLAGGAEAVDLLPLARATADRLGARARAGGVRLVVAGQPARVAGDQDALGRAPANLVDNAVKASPPGEAVTLTARRERETAGVTVADRGPGVPADARERVFDRFARLDDARTRADGGAGLGLAICRELVRAHGGDVTVEGSEVFDSPAWGPLKNGRCAAAGVPECFDGPLTLSDALAARPVAARGPGDPQSRRARAAGRDRQLVRPPAGQALRGRASPSRR